QDGMRVRASAGAASFRREASLRRCLEEARTHVAAVKDAGERPADPRATRREAAAARAAREREKRVARALAELPAARAAKRDEAAKAEARVSTTDPEARVAERTGQQPTEYLVDGGFAKLESIAKADADGVTVYAPVPTPRRADIDPHAPKSTDEPAVAAWRARMGTDEAKAIYKDRAAVAETVNADLRAHRGLDRFPVRGLAKVQ